MLQQSLIRYLLNPLAKFMQRFSEKAKERLFVAAGLAIFVMLFLHGGSVIQWRYLYEFVICCAFLGIMILCSLSPDMKPVKFRLPIAIPWFGAGLLILLSGIQHNVEYLPEAMLILVAYPVAYICWNNMDREKVIRLLIRIARISLLMFLAASFLLIEITNRKYGGIFRNVNSCAFYLAMVAACLGAEILQRRKFDKKCIADILLFGACEAMIYYTNSRTGQLAVYAFAAVGIVLYLITHSSKERLQCILRSGCCILASVVMIHSLVYVFQTRELLPVPYYEKSSRTFYFAPVWEEKLFGDRQDPNVENTENQFFDNTFGVDRFAEINDQKNDTEGKSLNSYSTGRIGIWKAYGSDLNLFGHDDMPVITIVDEEGDEAQIRTAHMTILEIAYKSGVIAGVLYLALNIASGILAIWYAIKCREEVYALFPIMVILVFGVCSLLASISGSFGYATTLFYYFSLFPLMIQKSQEKTADPAAE